MSLTMIATAVVATLTASPAYSQSDSPCSRAADTTTLLLTGGEYRLRVVSDPDPALDGQILVNGQPCGATPATVNNTATVLVDGSDGNDALMLILRRPFVSDSGHKVEFDIDLAGDQPSGGDEIDRSRRRYGDSLELIGGGEGDHLVADSNSVSLDGAAPAQLRHAGVEILYAEGREGDDVISGAGLDGNSPIGLPFHLYGGEGDDTLTGGSGRDRLVGQADSDILDGGEGRDIAGYFGSSTGVEVELPQQGETTTGSRGDAEGERLTSVEGLAGTHYDDVLVGNSEANVLVGRGGDDLLRGGEGRDTLLGDGGDLDDYPQANPPGNDRLRGGQGADRLNGGPGFDLLDYKGADSGVRVSLKRGTGRGGDAEGDVFGAVEGIVGSGHADVLTGNSRANLIQGRRGNDVIYGLAGADRLDGGRGDDAFPQGPNLDAGDLVAGGRGDDTIGYRSRRNPVKVSKDGRANDGERGEGDNVDRTVEVVRYPTDLPSTLEATIGKARIDQGDSTRVQGKLTRRDVPLKDRRVYLQARKPGGSAWHRVSAERTGPRGGVRFTVQPSRTREYRLRFAGDRFHRAANSSVLRVRVRR